MTTEFFSFCGMAIILYFYIVSVKRLKKLQKLKSKRRRESLKIGLVDMVFEGNSAPPPL